MSTQLEQVFSQNRSALTEHPDQGRVTFAAESRGHEGLHRRVTVRARRLGLRRNDVVQDAPMFERVLKAD